MLKKARAVIIALLVFTAVGFAQDHRFDFSMNYAAIFTKQSSGYGITQSATIGSGGFGTIRVRFSPKHAFIFDYGRFKNSQIYRTFDNFHNVDLITEYTAGYMYSPFKRGRWEPFVLAGVGPLRFGPRGTWVIFPPLTGNIPNNVQVNLHATKQTEFGFMYGFGVDYRLPRFRRFALRFQYRGFVYKDPDFRIDATGGSDVSLFTGAISHMAEPSGGLVFKF
jgi:hypothetical protein